MSYFEAHWTGTNIHRGNNVTFSTEAPVRTNFESLCMPATLSSVMHLGHLLAFRPSRWCVNLHLLFLSRVSCGVHIPTGHVRFNETPADLQRWERLFFMKRERAKGKGGERQCTWLKNFCSFSLTWNLPGPGGDKNKLGLRLCISLEEKRMVIEAMIWDKSLLLVPCC